MLGFRMKIVRPKYNFFHSMVPTKRLTPRSSKPITVDERRQFEEHRFASLLTRGVNREATVGAVAKVIGVLLHKIEDLLEIESLPRDIDDDGVPCVFSIKSMRLTAKLLAHEKQEELVERMVRNPHAEQSRLIQNGGVRRFACRTDKAVHVLLIVSGHFAKKQADEKSGVAFLVFVALKVILGIPLAYASARIA